MPDTVTSTADEGSVARHYDALDRFYREIWGEHVHHGLWRTGQESVEEATRALVDLVVAWAHVRDGSVALDVGCGYGGTSRILAREHGCLVTGFTLSGEQAAWAEGRGPAEVRYQVRSWLENGVAEESCDAVVAIESLSHMLDKPLAFREAARVLRPGGRLVLVDWLSGEHPSALQRRLLLEPIAREGRLPGLSTMVGYESLAESAGLRVIHTEDLSAAAHRTWSIVGGRLVRRVVRDRAARRYLLSRANPDRSFGFSLIRIPVALRSGAMQLVLLAAQKPA